MIKRVGEGDNDVNACDSYGDTNSNYNYSELLIPRTCRADDQEGRLQISSDKQWSPLLTPCTRSEHKIHLKHNHE